MRNLIAAAICAALTAGASAASINGLTFSVTADEDYYLPEPYSYGYVTLGSGGAEAGMWGYNSEWIAARSEFDLTGISRVSTATLTFMYYQSSSSQPATPGYPDSGFSERIFTYMGDNQAEKHDFTPNGASTIGSIDGIGATLLHNTVLTFDVASQVNAILGGGGDSLGVGINWSAADHFASYGNFVLTVTPVPEPQTYAMLAAGLALLGAVRARQAAKAETQG